MRVEKYCMCDFCFQVYNHHTGAELPFCDFCSSPVNKIKMRECSFLETLLLHISFNFKEAKNA